LLAAQLACMPLYMLIPRSTTNYVIV